MLGRRAEPIPEREYSVAQAPRQPAITLPASCGYLYGQCQREKVPLISQRSNEGDLFEEGLRREPAGGFIGRSRHEEPLIPVGRTAEPYSEICQ